jgi:hypothetical protein
MPTDQLKKIRELVAHSMASFFEKRPSNRLKRHFTYFCKRLTALVLLETVASLQSALGSLIF